MQRIALSLILKVHNILIDIGIFHLLMHEV